MITSFAMLLTACSGSREPTGTGRISADALTACDAQTEADRLFDEELAVSADAVLPSTLDTSTLSATQLGTLAFALEAEYEEVRPALDVEFALARGPLGRVAVLALSGGESEGSAPQLDVAFLQRGFDRYYACVRGFPATRDDFVLEFGDYRDADPETVESSAVKDEPRTLYQLEDRGIFIAETGMPGAIETEVILQGTRPDGALDFFAYDAEGKLVMRVMLPKIDPQEPLAAPSACIQCHRDSHDNRIDNVDPRTE